MSEAGAIRTLAPMAEALAPIVRTLAPRDLPSRQTALAPIAKGYSSAYGVSSNGSTLPSRGLALIDKVWIPNALVSKRGALVLIAKVVGSAFKLGGLNYDWR